VELVLLQMFNLAAVAAVAAVAAAIVGRSSCGSFLIVLNRCSV